MSNKVKVNVSKKCWDKVKILCQKISKVEWSGVIFYSITGSLKKPEKMIIEVIDLIPLDKGSSAYTEYTIDSRLITYADKMGYLEQGLKMGHIHSHNVMKTFFSGTDQDELKENTEFNNPYLSLIVNNALETSCKIAFRAEVEGSTKYKFTDINDKKLSLNTKMENSEIVLAYDCDVFTEEEFIEDDYFYDQLKEIMKPKVKPITVKSYKNSFDQKSWFDHKDLDDTDDFGFDIETTPALSDYNSFFSYVLMLGNIDPEHDMQLQSVIESLEESNNDKQTLETYALKMFSQFPRLVRNYYGNDIDYTNDFLDFIYDEFIDELESWEENSVKIILNKLNTLENAATKV